MLEDLIAQEIRREGPVPFCRFMDLCLYHPEGGYYMAHRPIQGKEGDYFTAPTLGPLFGRTLAGKIALWASEEEGGYTIVEVGGGTGYLAEDILSTIQGRFPDLFGRLLYFSVEVNPHSVQEQRERLASFGGRVRWAKWEEVWGIEGLILMNEVLDALPCHRVKVEGGELYEAHVDLQGDGFREVLLPARREIREYFDALGIFPPEGTYAEAGIRALEFLEEAASKLEEGRILILDYGLEAEELLSGAYPEGTLRAYKGHRVYGDLYSEPGKRDLTAHVNFSALLKKAGGLGLEVEAFSDLGTFLLEAGILEEAKGLKERLQAKWLLLPEAMGRIFKALVLRKGGKG